MPTNIKPNVEVNKELKYVGDIIKIKAINKNGTKNKIDTIIRDAPVNDFISNLSFFLLNKDFSIEENT